MPAHTRAYHLFALIALLALSATALPQRVFAAAPAQPQALLDLINAERLRAGLQPFKLQANLGASAQWLAEDMGIKRYFNHVDSLKRHTDARLLAFGYSGYKTLGENIAAGQSSAQDAFNVWMNSPTHHDVLMDPTYAEVGIGFSEIPGSPYDYYWVLDVGRRSSVTGLVVDGDAATTDRANVRVDLVGEVWAAQMRLSNDGVNWSGWEPVSRTKTWTLSSGAPGLRSVWVELEATDGASEQTQDAILLTVANPLVTPDPTTRPNQTTRRLLLPLTRH